MKNLIFSTIAIFFSLTAKSYIGGTPPNGLIPAAISWRLGPAECSGTRISDHHIVTAAHCILALGEPPQSLVNAFGFEVAGELGIAKDSSRIQVNAVKIHFHPDVSSGAAATDVAVIETEAMPKGPMVQISSKPPKMGEKFLLGGYGCKGEGFADNGEMTIGFKTPVDLVSELMIFGIKDFDGKSTSFGCPGDSGGGVFRLNSQNIYELVAVNQAIGITRESFAKLTVDAKTGKITSYVQDPQPVVRVVALASGEGTIEKWLRSILPTEVFSK